MPLIKRVSRIDYYLEVVFDDDSVRAIEIAHYLNIDATKMLQNKPTLSKIPVRADSKAIIWDDGTEIPVDFLYDNSMLMGWIDKSWGINTQAWQPIKFTTAQIMIELRNSELHSSLLLDEKPYPALMFSSVSFGIYENIPWYHIPFPGDNGVYEPEWEESPIVLDTLDQLVEMTNNAIDSKTDTTLNISDLLQKTGCELFVKSISPRNAAIFAKRFKRNSA